MFADSLANTYISGVRGNKKFPFAKMSLVKQDEETGGEKRSREKETRERFSLCGGLCQEDQCGGFVIVSSTPLHFERSLWSRLGMCRKGAGRGQGAHGPCQHCLNVMHCYVAWGGM